MSTPFASIRGLSKSYVPGTRVLDQVGLEVTKGSLTTIVGLSGSGKTTLLNLLGGLDGDYEGSIAVDGVELAGLSDRELATYRNQTASFVFQSFCLLEHLSCLENVAVPALFTRSASRPSRSELRQRGLEVLERVGLADRAQAMPGQLSGGERQRVSLARALFNQPQLVLCDEITGNLDQSTASTVLGVLESLCQGGTTVVAATHDEALCTISDATYELAAGKLHILTAKGS